VTRFPALPPRSEAPPFAHFSNLDVPYLLTEGRQFWGLWSDPVISRFSGGSQRFWPVEISGAGREQASGRSWLIRYELDGLSSSGSGSFLVVALRFTEPDYSNLL
jgi:hypothetical protein